MIKNISLILISTILISIISNKKDDILLRIKTAKEAVELHHEDKSLINQEKIINLINEHPDIDNYTFLICITTHNCYLDNNQIIKQYNAYLDEKNTDFNWLSKLSIIFFIINFSCLFFIMKNTFLNEVETYNVDELRALLRHPIITDLNNKIKIELCPKIIDKLNSTENINNIRILNNFGVVIYTEDKIIDDHFQEIGKNKYLVLNYSMRKAA